MLKERRVKICRYHFLDGFEKRFEDFFGLRWGEDYFEKRGRMDFNPLGLLELTCGGKEDFSAAIIFPKVSAGYNFSAYVNFGIDLNPLCVYSGDVSLDYFIRIR